MSCPSACAHTGAAAQAAAALPKKLRRDSRIGQSPPSCMTAILPESLPDWEFKRRFDYDGDHSHAPQRLRVRQSRGRAMYAKRVILQGAVLSASGMLISMACQLGGAMIFTRVLQGGVAVGVFTLLILAADFLTLVNNGGLWSALPKLVAAAPVKDRDRLIASALGFQCATSLGLAALIYIAWGLLRDPRLISANENWVGLYPFLWILPIIVFFENFRENVLAIQAGLNRYGLRASGLIAGALANFVLVAVAVGYLKAGLPGLMLAALAGYAASALISYLLLTEGRRLRLDWEAYRESLSFSAPLYVNNLLTFAFVRFDSVLVAAMLGPAAVAYYELGAKRLAGYGSRILQAALVPYLPNASYLIAQGEWERAAHLLDRVSNITVFVCYLGILAALAIQERLIAILFTAEYLNALPAFAPVLVSVCLGLQAGIMGQSLIALGKPRVVTMINAATALVAVAANLILIPRLGLAGAGWAAVTAMAFSNAAQTWAVRCNGLPIDLRRHVLAHIFMLFSLGILAWSQAVPGRVAAWFAFLALGIVGGVVPLHEIKALLPERFRVKG